MKGKEPLTGLFRDNPATPEGKYLVKRRDGSIPPWPSFVLGGADPMAPWTLRFYAALGLLFRELNLATAKGFWRWAGVMRDYRRTHGKGDPGMGRHRQDDPATVAEMRLGRSA